jgi:hypothetical protein
VTPAPELVSDALTVARWRDPHIEEWEVGAQNVLADTYGRNREWVSQCESLMVERGLGEAYGQQLMRELYDVSPHPLGKERQYVVSGEELAAIRTAPLSTVLRALAAVVRAEGMEKCW